MPTTKLLELAHYAAIAAREFADRGKDNAALGYLCLSQEYLVGYFLEQAKEEK